MWDAIIQISQGIPVPNGHASRARVLGRDRQTGWSGEARAGCGEQWGVHCAAQEWKAAARRQGDCQVLIQVSILHIPRGLPVNSLWIQAWTTNEPHLLEYNRLGAVQSHPLHRTHLSQYHAVSTRITGKGRLDIIILRSMYTEKVWST